MSTLQFWLAVLGGLTLAGVVAHGAWQSRRSEVKRAVDELPPVAADAKGEPAERLEPSFDGQGDDIAETAPAALMTLGDEPPLPRPTLAARRSGGPRLDALIDTIALLHPEAACSGEQVLAHLPATRRAGTKPLLIEGRNSASNDWELPRAGAVYREFQAGVQLANRGGAMNEIEYSEFMQKLEAFAESLQARSDIGEDMLQAVARARELDAFASQHDAQLALRLVSRGAAWSPGYVQQHAARHGFVPGALPGRLVLPGSEEGAPPVLTLSFDAQAALAEDPSRSAVRELTLSFDVPQTPAEQNPFAAWCAAGEALALALDAALFDDQGQPFSPQAFPAVGQALEQLYAALASRDLAAGSAAARRLFS